MTSTMTSELVKSEPKMTKRRRTVNVVVYRVGEEPFVETIEDTLDAQQEIVGGYIEGVGLGNSLLLICNEEGKLKGLPPNRLVPGRDLIVGNFFVTRTNSEGESDNITEADLLYLKKNYDL